MPIKIEYDGRVYEYEELDLDIDDAETIQKYVGRNLKEWASGVVGCEVKSMIALWWLLRKQAGEQPGPIGAKPRGFQPMRFYAAVVAAQEAEAAELAAEQQAAEAEAPEDPTKLSPALSSPASAVTTTIPDLAAAGPSLPG